MSVAGGITLMEISLYLNRELYEKRNKSKISCNIKQ